MPLVPWWSVLLNGIFAVIIGLLLLGAGDITKTAGLLTVVQILGWYWFFTGIMNIVMIFIDHTLWGWKLFAGLLGIVAGAYIIQHPFWSTPALLLTFTVLLGLQGIIIGVIDLVKAFKGGGWGVGLLGALSIFLGAWLIAERYMASLALPWVAGVFALGGGIGAIVMSFKVKKEQAAIA
jgi:uncharacterized membrane protein HdeD (DUF308 family)